MAQVSEPTPAATVVALDPFVRWVAAEREQIVERVTGRVVEEVPEVASDAQARQLLASSIDSHMPVFMALGRRERGLQPAELPRPAKRYARFLAEQGRPLLTLLRAYEVGHAEFWRMFAEALRTGRHRMDGGRRADVLEQTSALMFDYIQGVTALAVATHGEMTAHLERRTSSARARAVRAVLAGEDEPEVERALGYPLGGLHLGYVLWPKDSGSRLEEAGGALQRMLGPTKQLAVAHGDGSTIGWFLAGPQGHGFDVDAVSLPKGVGLAFGAPHRGVAGFRATHREALEARRVADALRATAPVAYEDVAVPAIASRDPDLARWLVQRELGPLFSADPALRRLVDTLDVFLRERGSPTRTGRELSLHRNTVIQRIERIEEITGRRIDTSSLPLRVAVALLPMVLAEDH